MKFEFEMDDIDVENLFTIMNRNMMRAFTRVVDAVRDTENPPTPATVQCLIDQFRYEEQLMNTVFGSEVSYMNLDIFDNYLNL